MTDSANQNQSTDDQGSGFAKKLDGRRIAVLAGQGVEQVELTDPMRAIRAAGGTPVIVSYSEGSFVAMKGDWEHADSFAVDVDVSPAHYEGALPTLMSALLLSRSSAAHAFFSGAYSIQKV